MIVHTTVQTMHGEGLEALAPSGDVIAVFSEGNLVRTLSNLSSMVAAQGSVVTVVLEND